MTIDKNTVICIVAICVAAVGMSSIITGHDQMELTLAVLSALAGASHFPVLGSKSNPDSNAAVPPQTIASAAG